MHLDNSACNLASLNLMKFVDDDMHFDIQAFRHAIDVVFLAQEILVGNSSYPTTKIEQNAKNFRELGLGYANLGALLMARGLPYDSDGGRAWAAAITALMTGWAYRDSALFAEQVGPHAGYAVNREPMLNVIRKHRAAADQIDPELVPEGLLQAAKSAWDDAIALGEEFGYRNAQASVLAPTGTIGLMMDCDTTFRARCGGSATTRTRPTRSSPTSPTRTR
jgi:ribonucleoside-diphosphate reductase alpha chain